MSCLNIFVRLFQNAETYDLEDFKYNFVNLTAFRLFDRRHGRVQMAMESFFAFKAIANNETNRRLFTVSHFLTENSQDTRDFLYCVTMNHKMI